MVFAQLMDFVPYAEFQKCVARYQADRHLRRFSCSDQWVCMAFAQLTHRESLRDLESCLRPVSAKLYHLGLRGEVSGGVFRITQMGESVGLTPSARHLRPHAARDSKAAPEGGLRLRTARADFSLEN